MKKRLTLSLRITHLLRLHRATLLVTLLFFIVTCLLTWPFILHPLTTQVGSNYGDIFASIVKFDAIKADGNNPFVDGRINSIAYPDGIRSNVGVDRVSFFSTLFLWVMTLLFNSTFAHNMYVFLGYFISSVVMFLFVRKYTKSTALGIFSGLAFITFPLFISLARAAPVYMWSWLYILPIWATIELTKLYSNKKLVLVGLSIIPGVFWTPYFMLHMFLIILACGLVYGAIYTKNHHVLPYKQILVVGGIVSLIACLYIVIGHSSAGSTVIPNRPISDAYDQSLNPFMLLTPTPYSVFTAPVYNSLIKPLRPRGIDTMLFAGYTIISLAIIGIYAVFRSKYLTRDMRRIGVLSLSISIIALAFSLAPTIHLFGLRIPTPNYFVVHAVPALRAGQRLVVPIMLGLIILAALGIYWLSKRIGKYVRYPILLGCVFTLVGIEYVTVFSQMTTPVYTSTSMQRLSTAPKGIVAEYFNDSIIGYPGQLACKNYMIYHMTTVNPCSLDIYTLPGKYPVVDAVDKLPLGDQITALRRIGVTYFIVDGTSVGAERHLLQDGYQLRISDTKFRIYSLN